MIVAWTSQTFVELVLFLVLFVLTVRSLLTRWFSPPPRRCLWVRPMVVAGSGGHTTEILRLVAALDRKRYRDIVYVVAETDHMSEAKIRELESSRSGADFSIYKIPRSREVGQSYLTAVVSTLVAALHSLALWLRLRPGLLLCNGPGTCIPLALIASAFRLLQPVQVVYVESVCRVRTLSLSAAILYYTPGAHVVVQWPKLLQRWPRAKFLGRLS